MSLGQCRHKKAPPPNFFSYRRGAICYDAGRGRKEKGQSNTRPRGHGTKAEVLSGTIDEVPVGHSAKSRQPDKGVSRCCVTERDEIANRLIARFSPFPSEASNTTPKI